MLYMTRTHGFYSIYTNIQWNNCHFPTELVQTKLRVSPFASMTIISLLAADRSLDSMCPDLAVLTVDKHTFQLVNVWNFATIYHLLQCPPNCIINRIKIRAVWRPVFRLKELRHIWAQVSNSVAWTMCRRSVLLKQIGEHCSRWCIVAKFQTLTSWNIWTNSVAKKWQLFHCMLV